MISWMQKHKRFLIWTIWIATIAFIASGPIFTGAGYGGSKIGSVAKVGDIDITNAELNTAYSNIYNQYNQMLQGKLDKEKAKAMGLTRQAFGTLETQAKVLSFAKDAGIIVSDNELANKLSEIQSFQTKGSFDKKIYDNYLKSQGLKAKSFESMLRKEILAGKVLSLLKSESLPLEKESIFASTNIQDKILYKVLTPNDINISADESSLKAFWETQKNNYMTERKYDLQIAWVPSAQTSVSNNELETFYKENSFNYADASGKILSFEDAKSIVTNDLKLKKTKKIANKKFIAFKKGGVSDSEKSTLAEDNEKLPKEAWDKIKNASKGDIIKPKIVSDKYAIIKVENIVQPTAKSFAEARETVKKEYEISEGKKALFTLAEKTLDTIDTNNATLSGFISLKNSDNLKPLNSQESLQFLEKLFTSNKEKGIISVLDKVIVYTIKEQKLGSVDQNGTKSVNQLVNKIKSGVFQSSLLEILDKRYPTEVYVEGLTN